MSSGPERVRAVSSGGVRSEDRRTDTGIGHVDEQRDVWMSVMLQHSVWCWMPGSGCFVVEVRQAIVTIVRTCLLACGSMLLNVSDCFFVLVVCNNSMSVCMPWRLPT